MAEYPEYKEDIIQTRVGGLGSSDAAMVKRVGQSGQVNYAAKERLAQMMGLIEKRQFSTPATRLGDEMENAIFSILKTKVAGDAVSNPLYIHKEYTEKYGFRIQDHIDFEIENDDRVLWFECKASKKSYAEVYDEYAPQLAWHQMCLAERAAGKKTSLFLVHYCTEDYDGAFDASRLQIHGVNLSGDYVHILIDGLDRIKQVLSDDFKFEQKMELVCSDLPAPLQSEVDALMNLFRMQKEAEDKIKEFKKRLTPLMEQVGEKVSISNDMFTLSYRGAYSRSSLDSKSLMREHPDIYEHYLKTTNVEATVNIRLKTNKPTKQIE